MTMNDVITHLIAFLTGGGLGFFLMSRKDRHDVRQTNFENTERLIQASETAYDEYTAALAVFDPSAIQSMVDFTNIATRGERYFASLNMVSSAILSGLIDENARDRMIVQRIKDAALRSIPLHYETLASIASERGFEYPDVPARSNYQAIYDAADRFATGIL